MDGEDAVRGLGSLGKSGHTSLEGLDLLTLEGAPGHSEAGLG